MQTGVLDQKFLVCKLGGIGRGLSGLRRFQSVKSAQSVANPVSSEKRFLTQDTRRHSLVYVLGLAVTTQA